MLVCLEVTKNIWFDVWISDKALRQCTQPKGVSQELDVIRKYLAKVLIIHSPLIVCSA